MRASAVYVFTAIQLTADQCNEAVYGAFFAKHPELDRRIAEVGGFRMAFYPSWKEVWEDAKANDANVFRYINDFCEHCLKNVIATGHEGARYLDAVAILPDGSPPCFIVLVWDAPVAAQAKALIPKLRIYAGAPGSSRTATGTTPIESKKGCFVATSVYGSSEHPNVECLRQFRDSKLVHFAAGRRFIAVYYRIGPRLARSPFARGFSARIVRIILDISCAILRLLAAKSTRTSKRQSQRMLKY